MDAERGGTSREGCEPSYFLFLRFPEEESSGVPEPDEPKETAPDWARRRDELSIALQMEEAGVAAE